MAASDHNSNTQFAPQRLSSRDVGKKVYYHGTSHDAAKSIMEQGFSLDESVNGRSAGEGIYLHQDPRVAADYGPAVVEVQISKGTKIAPKDTFWEHTREYIRNPKKVSSDYGDYVSGLGYQAHRDVDDNSIIVHHPETLRPSAVQSQSFS